MEWTPGHADIQGNDLADASAKEAAAEASRLDTELVTVTLQDVAKAAIDTVTSKWQLRWNLSDRGRHMYDLRSKVSLSFKRHAYPDNSSYTNIAQLRTGYARLQEYLHKTGQAPSPTCSCSESSETISHYLLECSNYDTERQLLEHRVRIATGVPQLSMELLLSDGPEDSYLHDRAQIIMELSHFIQSTARFHTERPPSAIPSVN